MVFKGLKMGYKGAKTVTGGVMKGGGAVVGGISAVHTKVDGKFVSARPPAPRRCPGLAQLRVCRAPVTGSLTRLAAAPGRPLGSQQHGSRSEEEDEGAQRAAREDEEDARDLGRR